MYSVPAISSLKFERLNLKIKADLYFAKKKLKKNRDYQKYSKKMNQQCCESNSKFYAL